MRVSPQRTEIAKLRAASGMLQKEAASKLGVSVGHLQQVELGTRKSNSLVEKARRELKKQAPVK